MSFQDCVITSVVGTNGQPLPLQGNSLGPTTKTVKKERHDEAEIQELAIKMMEQQKAALLKQQQQTQAAQMAAAARNPGLLNPAAAANGQQYINNYFQRNAAAAAAAGVVPPSRNGQHTNGSSNTSSAAANATTASPGPEKPKPNDDEESQKGHFGWTTFGGKVHIPYILRQQEKYCAVRMTETKLLVKYLGCLHPEIYSSCTCVRSYYITEAESRLLNEINHKHCDAQFGRDMFTHKDLVVRLSDATKFYQFLDICYRKLISGSKTPSEKCGFIRINKESVVPYTVRNGEQVVPLFYFEGETENLRQKADNLSGWDLAYLKFCCKVQGIRNELFSSESVAVISLTDIKSYFPNGTEFEDYWPSKVVDSNLLLSPQRHNSNNAINWTRQPSAPPPSKMMHQPQAAKQQQQQPNQQSNGNANRYNQQMQQNPVRNLQTAMTLEQLGQQFALGFMQPHMMAQAQVQQGKNNPLSRSHMVHMMNAIRENPRSFSNPIPNYSNGVVHYPNQQIPPPLVKQGNQSQNAMLNFTRHEQQQKRSLASNDPSPSTYKHSVNVNNPTNYPLSPMSSSSSTSSTPDLTSLSLWLNNQAAQKELLGQMAKTLQQQQHHQQQQQKHLQQQMSRDIKPSIPSLIPMNNTNIGSLQQNNSKFNMTKEMQDVVKKVLSNPDLSTFVQTNSSSNFVPFISPPVSPADSLTITPASPKPKSSYHHNNYHTNNNNNNNSRNSNNNSYNNKMADQMLRQKSVICSTSNVPSPATKQTLLQSHAKYRSPMEVIDLSNSSPTPSRLNSHYQQQMAQAAAQRLQMQSGVSVHSVGGGGGGSNRSGMSNGSQSGGGGNNVGNNQNSATMHLQRHAANLQQAAANGYGDQRLNVIPEVQNTMHAPPYKVQKVFVDNTTVPCINMKAYQDTDQLIALTDLREFLFPKASLDICKRSIEAIHVEMYKGNRKQVQILMENNRIPNEHVPLVQVRDILKFMPQLRYMIQNQMDQQQQQPLQKRARIS